MLSNRALYIGTESRKIDKQLVFIISFTRAILLATSVKLATRNLFIPLSSAFMQGRDMNMTFPLQIPVFERSKRYLQSYQ